MINYDALIIGGGYLGLVSGIALARRGIKTVVLERGRFDDMSKSSTPCKLFAISEGSCKIMREHIGVDVTPLGQSINHIRVMEFGTDAYLDFSPHDLHLHNFGVMLEESQLHATLLGIARKTQGLELVEKCQIVDVETAEDKAQVTTGDAIYSANIALVCDGKHSWARSLLGIETIAKNYQQFGVICDIWHKEPHRGIAIEKFTPQGPFAILPKKGGHESSIVWTLETDAAYTAMSLSPQEQLGLIEERFGDALGELKLKSQLKGFPLELKYATTYASGRFYLLGDALHTLHPLAGQGLNLSLRDFEFMINGITESLSLGLDVGMNANMAGYFKARHFDNQVMIESTDFINALFSNNLSLFKCGRSIGLDLVNQMPAVKRFCMRYAVGG